MAKTPVLKKIAERGVDRVKTEMHYGYRFREEQLDRICEFLFTNSGMAFCDESLRAALEITRTMVPARYLSKRGGPGKLSGVCVPVTRSSPPKEKTNRRL